MHFNLLLGAVMSAWEGDASSEAKLDIQTWIAHHVGWHDLLSGTRKTERKFNVWMFYDPTKGPRRVLTREVSLRYPLPR